MSKLTPVNEEAFIKTVTCRPAYDRRAEGGGIHGVEMCFILKGQKGATQFLLYTNWQLPHVQEAFKHIPSYSEIDNDPHLLCKPIPAYQGYHSYIPLYEGQTKMEECDILECDGDYYDGSTLAADGVYERLLTEGSDGVWAALEEFYNERLGDLDIQEIEKVKNAKTQTALPTPINNT